MSYGSLTPANASFWIYLTRLSGSRWATTLDNTSVAAIEIWSGCHAAWPTSRASPLLPLAVMCYHSRGWNSSIGINTDQCRQALTNNRNDKHTVTTIWNGILPAEHIHRASESIWIHQGNSDYTTLSTYPCRRDRPFWWIIVWLHHFLGRDSLDEVTRYSFCSKTHTFTDTVSMIAESFYFYLSSDALGFFLERNSLRILPRQTKASRSSHTKCTIECSSKNPW